MPAPSEEAKSIGYKSIELRAAIYLALTLSRLGQLRPALDLLRDARNTARQQGFAGLEAEALLAEATVMPVSSENDRAAIIRSLRNCIEIATQSEARPLRLKAEALLGKRCPKKKTANGCVKSSDGIGTDLYLFCLTRFLHANRYPLR